MTCPPPAWVRLGGCSSRFDCSLLTRAVDRKEHVTSVEEIMNALKAHDLTRSLRAASELGGSRCSPWPATWICGTGACRPMVWNRPGGPDDRSVRAEDRGMGERSGGKVRADLAFDKLRGLGFADHERTVRRAVGGGKAQQPAGTTASVPTVVAGAGRVGPGLRVTGRLSADR